MCNLAPIGSVLREAITHDLLTSLRGGGAA
jgi:hypothetical protein